MGLLWPLEPATAGKHRLYRRYLDGWWAKLLQPTQAGFRYPRVTYVDAFAGPGRYEGGEDGSPVFALDRLLRHTAVERMQLSRDRVHLVFIEKEHARYEHLSAELVRRFGPLDQLPVRVELRHGEAASLTKPILDELGAWGNPILAVFDSWGNVAVPLTLVQRIAHSRSGEVIVTFGPNWFNRREGMEPQMLDEVFGGREHWLPADREQQPDERWRTWLATYRSSLSRAGFPYQLTFEVVPRTGQPLDLVFGTGHPSGVEVMKDAMWHVDGNDGMTFRDPRTRNAVAPGQGSLFDELDDSPQAKELSELVRQRLAEKSATVEELGTWLLLETARWRRTHAREAVQRMFKAGQITVEPPGGRIAGRSLVRLR